MKPDAFVAAVLLLAGLVAPRVASAAEHITVLVPTSDNLQFMSFWVAKYGGYFEREGIDVELVIAPSPQQTESVFERAGAEAAVLPPPMYLRFMSTKVPVVLVANLLRNDPIDLIVRRSVLDARKLSTKMPLKARLEGLRGLRLGVAPHPPTRLRTLFTSQGLDVDKELTVVTLRGKEQNAAFRDGKVDVLYAHTPYLEQAIVKDDAVVLVEQTKGELASLSNRQIHCLAFRRPIFTARPGVVLAMVRAIAAAQKSIHASVKGTVDVLARGFPTRDRRELETVVDLYEPAIPDSPDVHIEDLAPALALFPDGQDKPDLTNVDLASYVASDLAPKVRVAQTQQPENDVRRAWSIVIGVAIACALAMIVGLITAKRKADPSI